MYDLHELTHFHVPLIQHAVCAHHFRIPQPQYVIDDEVNLQLQLFVMNVQKVNPPQVPHVGDVSSLKLQVLVYYIQDLSVAHLGQL